MVRETQYGPDWEQSDYGRAKDAIENLETDFIGPGSGRRSLEFDLGDMVECEYAMKRARWLQDALEFEGFDVDEARFKTGYRGAMNNALILEVEMGEEVYS